MDFNWIVKYVLSEFYIFQQDLEQRKWPKLAKLGLLYHIHDIIGAKLVDW